MPSSTTWAKWSWWTQRRAALRCAGRLGQGLPPACAHARNATRHSTALHQQAGRQPDPRPHGFPLPAQGNALVAPNGTDQCNPEYSAALLRQVVGIDIASGLVLAWVRGGAARGLRPMGAGSAGSADSADGAGTSCTPCCWPRCAALRGGWAGSTPPGGQWCGSQQPWAAPPSRPLFLQDVAGQLPSISGALNSINLPTIPLVNFDLDSLTAPVADAAGNLQGLLDDGAPAAGGAWRPAHAAGCSAVGTRDHVPPPRPPALPPCLPAPAVCNITLLLVRENRVWPLCACGLPGPGRLHAWAELCGGAAWGACRVGALPLLTSLVLARLAAPHPLLSPADVNLKTYVCCDLTSSISSVYTAWVVAGSLTFVLCLAASLRVITATTHPTGRADYSTRGGDDAAAAAAAIGEAVAKVEPA